MPSDNLLGRSVHQNWCHFIAAIDTGPNLLKWFRYKKILVGVYCISCLCMCTILVYWVRGSDWRMNKTLQHKEEKNFRWKSTVITKPKCLTTKGKYFTAKNVVFYISNNMEDYKSERLISTLFFFKVWFFFNWILIYSWTRVQPVAHPNPHALIALIMSNSYFHTSNYYFVSINYYDYYLW